MQNHFLGKDGWVWALFILLLPLCSFAKPVYVTHLRTSAHAHHWRLVFTATGPIHYTWFRLKNPRRIVIDVDNAKLAHSFKNPTLWDTPVKNIRIAERKNHRLRLVLDMNYAIKAKLDTLRPSGKYGYRLVVDLEGKKQPVLAFNWPFNSKKAKKASIKGSAKTKTEVKKIRTGYIPKTKKRPRKIIIVIDPGHGGKDPGATGPGGTHEKNIVLAISKDLERLMNKQPGFKAVLTRRSDYYISLRRRLTIARKDKADMFVAIHADAFRNRHAHGASVYALSRRGATSEAARWLAARENKSELMGGVNLSDKSHLLRSVLINLSQTATIRASLQIGQVLLKSLDRITQLHHSRVEQAAFVVLKSPDIPSLLVEAGYITNPHEERRLRTVRYRKQLASAIMHGITRYFDRHPPRGTWLARRKKHN